MCTVKYDKVILCFLIKIVHCRGSGFELLSALLCLAAVCHDSRLSSVRATTEIPCVNDFRVARFSMFEPLLCSLTFLMCSAFLVSRDLPVSPKYRQIF